MHDSTKRYVKRGILAKMDECGITLQDIQICLDELKDELTPKEELTQEQAELYGRLFEYASELKKLHTHTNV